MNTNRALNIWRDNWSPISDLRREFDSLFDDSIRATYDLTTTSRFTPACEVEEGADHYQLSLDVPGIKKEDLKIELIGNQIVISGERRFEDKNRAEGLYYSERGAGKFQRSFTIPAGVEVAEVEASYQEGVLQIFVPKAESVKPRLIKIAQGNAGSKFLGKLYTKSKDKEETSSSSEHRDQAAS